MVYIKLVIRKNNYSKGDIVRILRDWTDLTQKDFAKSINKSKSSLQKYELNEVNYGIETLLDIAKKYDLTITIEKN